MREKGPKSITDKAFAEALLKSYIARSKLFYYTLERARVVDLAKKVSTIPDDKLSWKPKALGITAKALQY